MQNMFSKQNTQQGFPIRIPLRGIARNCTELHATVFVLRGIARELQSPQLRASKIHLRWELFTQPN